MERLVAVFFAGVEAEVLPYRKALVYESQVDFFLGLGAVTADEFNELPKADHGIVVDEDYEEVMEEVEPAEDGDKGHGEVGSLLWHKNQIKNMFKKKAVVQYATEVIGYDADDHIDQRKSLADIRKMALQLIEEYLNNGGQS